MCGIAGFLDREAATSRSQLETLGRGMQAALRHRGPDSQGLHIDELAGLVLAHTRLAVLDLSPAGAQPMLGPGGEALVYNGELYNHARLRPHFADYRGHSDTEVLLKALLAWGPLQAARESSGMFAWAFWQEGTLWLARDRAGEKPLYYYAGARYAGFASELPALRSLPGFSGELDRQALAEYLGLGYVPGPRSIYAGVRKLQPGTLLSLGREVRRETWWSPPPHQPETLPEAIWLERTHQVLSDAVADQMLADVPVGAFLSGGIDSSTIVGLMQERAPGAVHTYTIGCSQWGLNEAPYAREVARRLGTQHTELDVTPAEMLAVIPSLPAIYGEPFADSSQINAILISRLARPHVTVALTGDGADELFGGYNRYLWAGSLHRRLRRLPAAVRRLAAWLLRRVPPERWDALLRRRWNHAGAKVYKLAHLLQADSPGQVYARLVACWHEELVVGVPRSPEPAGPAGGTFEEWMMEEDFGHYLPDDILVKVDRASMAVGLETRAPYLDPRVVALSRRLPLELKLRRGQSKWVLRRLLQRWLPADLLDRPKMGFAVPLHDWLRGPLREWAQALLTRPDGYLHQPPIEREWRRFLRGASEGEHRIWAVLMFRAWLERQS